MASVERDQGDGSVGRDRADSGSPVEGRPLYVTVNYLFAAFLQTRECGGHQIQRVEKVRPGKAKFFFSITEKEAERLKLKFLSSSCSEFERLRKYTIDLAYGIVGLLLTRVSMGDSLPFI